MPPQPLSTIFRGQERAVHIHADAILMRPQHAALVMRVISLWSHADNILAGLVTSFLDSDFETVTTMLQALTSGDGKRAAINAAAIATLNQEDLKLYQAVMKVIKPSRDRRNDFAHHLWGFVEEIDDALLLVDPKYVAMNYAQTKAAIQKFKTRGLTGDSLYEAISAIQPLDLSKIFFFRKRDLEQDVQDARTAHKILFELSFALSDHIVSAQMRSRLSSLPQIQQALEPPSNKNG